MIRHSSSSNCYASTAVPNLGLGARTRNCHPSLETFVYDLLGASLILAEDWNRLSSAERERLLCQTDHERALSEMVDLGLLTPFQAARISTGNTFGLVLGNFRILERLGAGGMAVVYKAEHIEMRHLVAIKVVQLGRGDDPRLEVRFSAEMRTVARLRHPNIVTAMDAGRVYPVDPDAPVLWYLVMEYVPGENLEEYVRGRGLLPVPSACNLIHQVAGALAETHKLRLVHRDIKPSNILVTPEEQAKLLDFGLSRNVTTNVTRPGTVLGTLDFMAPEQAIDSHNVDIRADIYSLGGTFYYCLTGQLPFTCQGSEQEVLIRRISQEPPRLRRVMPELPVGLEAVVQKMMAVKPEDRFQTPQEVMSALLPFSLNERHLTRNLFNRHALLASQSTEDGPHRILIVDDEPALRQFCREILQSDGLICDEAENGEQALLRANIAPHPDLVLLDVNMPGMQGPDVLRELRSQPPMANLKVVMYSGQATSDEMSQMLIAGADDYLSKPFSVPQLLGHVHAALRLKEAQDRSDLLARQLLVVNSNLENTLQNRNRDLCEVQTALVLMLARLAQERENYSGHHLQRLTRYCRCLAEHAARVPPFDSQIDGTFVDMLAACAPLHDVGTISLPDHILLNPGKLSPEERLLMQTHTTVPTELLRELAEQFGAARAFLQMTSDVIRHHHERFDGTGYPDRLAGNEIPLGARIVAFADVYDALRSRRSYKPALSHHAAMQVMATTTGQFDPALMEVFLECGSEFEQIYRELPN